MRAIHVSVHVAPVSGALSHGTINIIITIIIIVIIIIIIITSIIIIIIIIQYKT